MTNVGPLYNWHLPVHDDDTSQLATFITEYLQAGYREPIMFAAPMDLTVGGLNGYGPIDSKRFQQKYIEVMRKLWAEVEKHNHPVIFSIGDEFTNKGLAGVEFAGKLARLAYEELPEIPITSDMNGYMEVMAMAPYLHYATFNNGWDGADRHNKGRRLLNDKFIEELKQKTGAIPYFVNAGKGRFPFGFFLWKMSKYGVRGKVEWYYCLGDNEKGSVVRVSGTEILPTIDVRAVARGCRRPEVCQHAREHSSPKRSSRARRRPQPPRQRRFSRSWRTPLSRTIRPTVTADCAGRWTVRRRSIRQRPRPSAPSTRCAEASPTTFSRFRRRWPA